MTSISTNEHGALLSDLPLGGSLTEKNLITCPHMPIFSPVLKFTLWCMAERKALFGHTSPQAGSSTADESIQPLHAKLFSMYLVFFNENSS